MCELEELLNLYAVCKAVALFSTLPVANVVALQSGVAFGYSFDQDDLLAAGTADIVVCVTGDITLADYFKDFAVAAFTFSYVTGAGVRIEHHIS